MLSQGFGFGHERREFITLLPRGCVRKPNEPFCMNSLDSPFVILIISLVAQCLAVYAGHLLRKSRPLRVDDRDDFDLVRTATLTLLALIIGFSFSMAVSRYDQRKNYEEAEANAIGTEYVRADLLPTADAMSVRELLRKYNDQRILFYRANDEGQIKQIDADTAKLQAELLVRCLTCGKYATVSYRGPCGVRHERCTQFARIHPGSMVEPHTLRHGV
jgi:hypothetical protein